MKNRIIIIGGAPCSGKSTLAKRLSVDLNISFVSTDLVRSIMKQVVSKKDYPSLFIYQKADPLIYLTSRSIDELVVDQINQCEATWKGVEALIKSRYGWEQYIVEGVASLPHLIYTSFSTRKDVKSLFLGLPKRQLVREVIYTRGLWDKAEHYPDSIKDIEVAWVMAFNDYLIREANRYGHPILNLHTNDLEYNMLLNDLS